MLSPISKLFVICYFTLLYSVEAVWNEGYKTEVHFENPLFCSDDKKCTPISLCPEVLTSMNRKELPVRRFRQLVCGYVDTAPKVCCDSKTQSTMLSDFDTRRNVAGVKNEIIECGKSLIRSNLETIGTFPFVARIGFINVENGQTKYPCGGTVVNERTILTTGTCALATSNKYKLHSVLLGEFDAATDPDCNSLFCGLPAQEYNISYVVKHPNFQADTFENNVALIRLGSSINFTVTVQKICLVQNENYKLEGISSLLVGWGKMSNQREKPLRQQWLLTKILSKRNCSMFTEQGFSVDLCGQSLKEPCSGFSGSPLVIKYSDTFVLIGILSYGSDCEINSNSPSAFVSIGKYSKWILANS